MKRIKRQSINLKAKAIDLRKKIKKIKANNALAKRTDDNERQRAPHVAVAAAASAVAAAWLQSQFQCMCKM